MSKGERISQLLTEFSGDAVDPDQTDVTSHPFYRAFFHCWNEQRYYEAHDVLEQLWLKIIFRSDTNIHRMQSTAGVCLLRCVYSGSQRKTCRGSAHAIAGWMSPRFASFYALMPIKLSRPITKLIRGCRKPRRN